jgi:hypothetical protein
MRIERLGIIATLMGLVLALTAVPATAVSTFAGTNLQAVESLPVANELRTGYSRTLFRHWIDVDRDCQNARAEVLIQESFAPVTFTTVNNCTVATGSWLSYMDNRNFTSASSVSIDHTVALAEAWDSGAHSWTAAEREAFANDLGDSRSLVAVSTSINSSKSDNDPTQWLPAFDVCRYINDWIAVKLRWGLSVDTNERSTLLSRVQSCGVTSLTVEVIRGSVAPPPPPPAVDTEAPTLSGTLSATSAATSISLSWLAATDNVGVARYSLRKNGVEVLSSTALSYSDAAVVRGATYFYEVSAFDAAGNQSSTLATTITVPAGLAITGSSRITAGNRFADLNWTGATTRVDLWRGTTRLLRNTTVSSHSNQVTRTTTSAIYTVCPTGQARTSVQCASVTVRW